jgi:uncharacterized Zn finger protein
LSLCHESPNLENYCILREAAQRLNQWEPLRQGLIQELKTDQNWDLLIEIALEEGDIDQALEYLPHQRWGLFALKVARAAETPRPQAAIEIYWREVERLIRARGRNNYHEAASILQRVKSLYHREGAHTEWDSLLADLRQRHARLPALMDELNKASL